MARKGTITLHRGGETRVVDVADLVERWRRNEQGIAETIYDLPAPARFLALAALGYGSYTQADEALARSLAERQIAL